MTIAAGFVCSDGVILGADSRVESYEIKYDQQKVFDCSPQSHNFGMFMTGCGGMFSIAGLANKMRARIAKSTGTLHDLETAIDAFSESKPYIRALEEPNGLDLLFAIRSKDHETRLFHLFRHTLVPVASYECIGVGHATARYVTKWLYHPGLPIRVFGPLSLQIFREAKEHNAGCEGDTKIVKLFNSGQGHGEPQMVLMDDSKFLWGIHDLLKPIVVSCVDPDIPDENFEKYMTVFGNAMRDVRSATMKAKESGNKRHDFFKTPNVI